MTPDALGDAAALLDIDIACEKALSFVAGLSRDQFKNDARTHSAVLYQLLIAGEAVRRVSPAFQ